MFDTFANIRLIRCVPHIFKSTLHQMDRWKFDSVMLREDDDAIGAFVYFERRGHF